MAKALEGAMQGMPMRAGAMAARAPSSQSLPASDVGEHTIKISRPAFVTAGPKKPPPPAQKEGGNTHDKGARARGQPPTPPATGRPRKLGAGRHAGRLVISTT